MFFRVNSNEYAINAYDAFDYRISKYNDPLSLNLYTYCSNNPIRYFDPSGHWKIGDENLNDDAKIKMIALTNAYHEANTKAEKRAIHRQAEAIRSNTSSYDDKDTLVEINNVSAYDAYMSEAVKDEKLTDKEIDESNSLIQATVSISSGSYFSASGEKTSVTNTLLSINNAVINVNSSVVSLNGSNKVLADINISTTTRYEAYIFYLPEWEGEMKDARSTLASYYGIDEDDIGTTSVTSADELSTAWNSIGYTEDGNNVSAVVVDTHASPISIGFGKSNSQSMSTNQIANLENKPIDNLVLYGCNAGHLDYKYSNVAAVFSQKVNGGKVLASDGTVGYGSREILWIFGKRVYTSKNDKTFKKYVNGNLRDNTGFIVYQYNQGNIVTSNGLGKSFTLEQMLDNMK